MKGFEVFKLVGTCLFLTASIANVCDAQIRERVVDIATRPGVVQRFVYLAPAQPKASVVLFAGGNGGLQISGEGSFAWGKGGNFLVRSRRLFADQNFAVAVVDAPSDRKRPSYLDGFRQIPEHALDIRAVIAWLRKQSGAPVWLIGTSRGTGSVASIATKVTGPEGPDGIVLTSTILSDGGGRAVPDMDLSLLKVPILVVHHEQDGYISVCRVNSRALWINSARLRERSSLHSKAAWITVMRARPLLIMGSTG